MKTTDEIGVLTPLGHLLREWRAARRLSQLDLALDSEISARHLSYIETGKAQPSRDLLHQVAEALDMPLRERNAMMLAAGYAPIYRESDLSDPEMRLVASAIDFMLAQQEPFPAFVIDRCWNVRSANASMRRLLDSVKPGGPIHANIVRQVFDPEDMRPYVANWEDVARDLIRHLHHSINRNPADGRLRALLDEAMAYPGVPTDWRRREFRAPVPVITTIFRGPSGDLGFLSSVTEFGTSFDITAEETRIECMHPLDEPTRAHCKTLAGLA